jgi:galactose mutarotase-like enzyme
MPTSPSAAKILQLNSRDGALAVIAPELGGWLLRYARPTRHGLVDALHFSQAVVDRYPREMWAGNPLLFPMVSFNHLPGREHHYAWGGREFPLPQHGFARRSAWRVAAHGESALTMELVDDEATRAVYPFAFRHRVTYRLDGGRLHFEQTVENSGAEPMPFSTGIHPYFQVPLTPDSERNRCFVRIPACQRLTADAGSGQFTATSQPPSELGVGEDVSGTMFLGGFAKSELTLVDPAAGLEIVLNWEDAPQHRFCALWSRATDAPFYCLEPWTALPNSFSRAQPREVIVLSPGEIFRAAMWMELRESRNADAGGRGF